MNASSHQVLIGRRVLDVGREHLGRSQASGVPEVGLPAPDCVLPGLEVRKWYPHGSFLRAKLMTKIAGHCRTSNSVSFSCMGLFE